MYDFQDFKCYLDIKFENEVTNFLTVFFLFCLKKVVNIVFFLFL